MRISPNPVCVCALALWSLPCPAGADGVHLDYQQLSKVLGASGVALEVTVRSCAPKGRTFSAAVDRVWRRAKGGGGAARLTAGKVYTFTPPAPPTFVPRRWVAYRVYWDTVPAPSIKAGQRLVLLSTNEDPQISLKAVVPDSARIRAKLKTLFRPDWESAYKKRTPTQQLEQDLADLDLYELAHAALKARRALRDAAVVAAAGRAQYHDLVRHHTLKVSKAARVRFLKAAARWVGRTRNTPKVRQQRQRMLRLLSSHYTNGLKSEDLPGLRALLLALWLDHEDDRDQLPGLNYALISYLTAGKRTAQGRMFVAHFLRYIPARPKVDRGEHLRKFVKQMTPQERDAFCLLVMKRLLPRRAPGRGKAALDTYGLTLVLGQAGRLPAGRMLGFVHRVHGLIDPKGDDACEQVAALAGAVAALSKRPKMAKRLGKLARELLPIYTCNVKSAHRDRLETLAK